MDDVPAFPVPNDDDHFYGMTLRDYFAAAALQGLIIETEGQASARELATIAYHHADAMLRARGEK